MKDKKNQANIGDWIFRVVKGLFIGTGFILPGVSGGALAAVFGIYERMISFLANLSHRFVENVLYFIPVGIGGIAGIVLLSFPLEYMLLHFEAYVMWFFIGCILGTLPALWKEAGKKGRNQSHWIILLISTVLGYIFLRSLEQLISGQMSPNFINWMLSGGIIALGVLIPGLSPSNFLLYLGMYQPMVSGFKSLDLGVVIPLGIGGLITLLALAKVINYLFNKMYANLFHFILGIVLASTLIIVPTNFNYLSLGTIICAVLCALGVALALWMSQLEDKYKPKED